MTCGDFPPIVLGLHGAAGVGKSTTARVMRELRPGLVIEHSGGALKAMTTAFLLACGVPHLEAARRVDGDLKRAPCPEMGGRTPTEFQQFLGTEFGRELIHPDLWVESWRRRAVLHLSEGLGVINDSVRFENEARAIRGLGGLVVGLRSVARGDDVGSHASEAGLEPDAWISADDAPEAVALAVLELAADRDPDTLRP